MGLTSVPASPPTNVQIIHHTPWQELVKEGIVERFVGLDMSDAETVFDRCLAAILKVRARPISHCLF